jgi:hypothetical protein
MKYYSAIAALVLVFGIAIACEDTNEDPVKQRGANIVPTIEFTSAPVFTTNLKESFVDFTVSLGEGETADGGSVEVLVNGERPTIVQEISSFPAQIHLTATEIISKMGINADTIETSDVFSFFVLTKKNGVTTRSVAAANIKIVCEFSPKLTKGLYKAVSESWEAEGVVNLVADENDPYHITLEGFNDIDGVAGVDDVFVQIDKASYAITNNDAFILSNDLEQDWGGDYAGYTNYTYKIVSGSYNSCDGSYTITFNISCALGSFGNYDFVFTRSEE